MSAEEGRELGGANTGGKEAGPPNQNSAELLGFCRKVLWKVLKIEKKPVEEPSYRTPRILQNSACQTLLILLPEILPPIR